MMKRRSFIAAALALAGAGPALIYLSRNLLSRAPQSLADACAALRNEWRRRTAADYRNGRTTVRDQWLLSETEAALLSEPERLLAEARAQGVCDD